MKQIVTTCTADSKATIQLLTADFKRPGAAKGSIVDASEKEIVEILTNVATDRRFKVEYVYAEDGSMQYDENGNPETVTVDLFEKEWEKIIARDYDDSPKSELERKRKEFERLKARLAKLEAEDAAAAAAAETPADASTAPAEG